ncbi:ABC transporter permease [Evansella tamaricis]|uniref:FtsX-like permease family protein n=1 Tax=Evansella tamaricis TaxID=2069301 RepID=A0ABS6JFV8_9BACI|nr:ABC transporter permease [Evansella tamaricis]MBU9712555.1 FtsX-like permease family protein [Evansella tamaricis]
MTLLKIIARKMINNRWLTVSLFLGLLITVSLVSSIPTYTSSVMHKLLVSDLEDFQQAENTYPTTYSFSINFSKDDSIDQLDVLDEVENFQEQMISNTGIPTIAELQILSTSPMRVSGIDNSASTRLSGRIMSFSGIEEHISITDGSLPSNKKEEGVVEAIVPERALLERDMVIGTTFEIGEGDEKVIVKPVGTFTPNDPSHPYWILSADSYSRDFIVDEEVFRNELLQNNKEFLETSRFVSAFDYSFIRSEDIASLLALDRIVNRETSALMETIILTDFPVADILKTYDQRSSQLQTMLWSLIAPVLVMLGIYLFMVSRLIIQRQLNEIAVFASRGAKRSQILLIYFIEMILLGTIALLIGPWIGLLFCHLLGATNGFLEFVQRTALPVEILPDSYLYAFYAVVASIFMVMVPVYFASKKSIVSHKQNLASSINQYKWYSIFFDLGLIAVSIYGLYTFQRNQQMISSSQGGDLYIDPVLFFLPAVFIIGLGLFVLRIYPWILRGIYKLGEKFWSISLYSTFLQVGRSAKQYQFFMLFLIMTIGIGVYSASSARTINTNMEEQILYQNGADIAIEIRWESTETVTTASAYDTGSASEELEAGTDEDSLNGERPEVSYIEPPFEPFLDLNGVEQATKVFHKEGVKAESQGQSIFSAQLMAIEPKEFGETAWFKPNLLPHHWYAYLNLMASEPSSVLISSSVSNGLGVKEGDYLTLQWSGSNQAEFVVYGIVDYWPSFNPNKQREGDSNPTLIIANLPYVQNVMGLEPYKVWLNVQQDSSRNDIYEQIREERIPVSNMNDVQPEIIDLKNSAFLLGLNGTLSLGFIISLFITLIGFLIYWIVTIKSRTLQYGVYRAMGIPMPKLLSILIWEQVMTSGFACFLGIIIGGAASQLFVPLFQYSFSSQTMVPPFQVIFDASDEMKIYIFVSILFIVGISILVILLKKIKIHQAIKLGED